MSKKLILIRHGKANEEQFGQKDINRHLEDVGKEQAKYVAVKLIEENIKIDQFLYSSATRTTETYNIISGMVNPNNSLAKSVPKLYLCSAQEISDAIALNAKDNCDCLAIIGHNNGLSDFYNQLTQNFIYHTISTCETIVLSLPISTWTEIYDVNKVKIVTKIKPKI